MSEARLAFVGMGEIRLDHEGDVLKATVGSCVGIVFLWKKQGRCGMAHCLLPEVPGPVIRPAARHVSQAVPSLIALMGIKPKDLADIDVVVVGGARMLRAGPDSLNVGRMNIEAAKKYLALAGLAVGHCEVGGRNGRQITVDCRTLDYAVLKIIRDNEEHHYAVD